MPPLMEHRVAFIVASKEEGRRGVKCEPCGQYELLVG